MFWNISDLKYLEKMKKNSLRREHVFFRRPVFINQKETKIKIKKIKNDQQMSSEIIGLKTWDENVCFLFEHKHSINTILFKKKCDIVGCDWKWKVVDVINGANIDKIIELSESVHNIWIFKNGIINFYKIKVNDKISTKDN